MWSLTLPQNSEGRCWSGAERGSAVADDVVLISPTFHPERIGTPLYATDLVRGLVEHGLGCRVVTSQPYYPAFRRFPGYGRGTRRDALDGVPVFRVPTVVPRRGGALGRALSDVNLLLQVALGIVTRRIGRSSSVVAVDPGVPLVVLAGSMLRRRNGRLLAVVHDVQFGLVASTGGAVSRRLSPVARAVEVWALNRASAVAAISAPMRGVLIDAGVSVPVHVVPLWPTLEPGAGGEPDPEAVLYSGNLGRKQGVDLLLDVAERLRAIAPSAHVTIRGEGTERPGLRAEAARRDLENVTFDDLVPEGELAATLAGAAVHVIPQAPKGADFAVPSKVYNILAVGRPVVVTAPRRSALARLAAEVEAVVVVEPGDVEAFAEAVARLLRDREQRERMGTAAREWVRRTRHRDVAIGQYLELLHRSPRSPGPPGSE